MFTGANFLKVYSPYQRNWLSELNSNIPHYLEDCPKPTPNPSSVRTNDKFSSLFHTPIPTAIEGFELTEADGKNMKDIFPEGEEAAAEVAPDSIHTPKLILILLIDITAISDLEVAYVSGWRCQSTDTRRGKVQ